MEHYKTIKHMGQVEVTCWKDPQEWPMGGSDKDRVVLTKLLESKFFSSLNERDALA